jgi:hypothetical protein
MDDIIPEVTEEYADTLMGIVLNNGNIERFNRKGTKFLKLKHEILIGKCLLEVQFIFRKKYNLDGEFIIKYEDLAMRKRISFDAEPCARVLQNIMCYESRFDNEFEDFKSIKLTPLYLGIKFGPYANSFYYKEPTKPISFNSPVEGYNHELKCENPIYMWPDQHYRRNIEYIPFLKILSKRDIVLRLETKTNYKLLIKELLTKILEREFDYPEIYAGIPSQMNKRAY